MGPARPDLLTKKPVENRPLLTNVLHNGNAAHGHVTTRVGASALCLCRKPTGAKIYCAKPLALLIDPIRGTHSGAGRPVGGMCRFIDSSGADLSTL